MALPSLGVAKQPSPPSRKTYRERLAARMKAARDKKDYTQAELAHILGISHEAYKKSEQRGALWADLIEPFAFATDEEPFYILTGRRIKFASAPAPAPEAKPNRVAKLRR